MENGPATSRAFVVRARVACVQVCLFLTATAVLADWTPPKNPEPSRILAEAQDDTRAGRYEDALAKHVWFHQEALKYEPGQYGVRLSFALAYWKQLAAVYPPALTRLKAVRDAAESSVRSGSGLHEAFSDFSAINRELNEPARTKDLFLWLDAGNPSLARQVFDLAEPALIQAKEFKLCGKYLDADRSYDQIAFLYRDNKRLARDPAMAGIGEFSERSFANGVATLVALLVLNDKKGEADRIRAAALRESPDPALRKLLEDAGRGTLPPPWP